VLEFEGLLKPTEGIQEKLAVPDAEAFNCKESPIHSEFEAPVILALTFKFWTETTMVSVAEQIPLLTFTT
jgi:hypothetical protein